MGAVEFFSIALPAVFWPLVVGLVVLTQRKPIGRLIDRVRSGRVFGQEFDAPPPGLAEAAEGGVSSPEVEEVIRSVSEGRQVLLDGRQPLVPVPGEEPASVDPTHPESSWAELLARLSEATQNDEDRRRSEIERVMRSSARWGAKVARSRPNDDDDWEPLVEWKDNGEPEIMVARGSAALTRRRKKELRHAQATYDAAFREHGNARRDLYEAEDALLVSSESAERQQRVMSAAMHEAQARKQMQLAKEELQTKLHNVEGS
jgi:hypothetical protein